MGAGCLAQPLQVSSERYTDVIDTADYVNFGLAAEYSRLSDQLNLTISSTESELIKNAEILYNRIAGPIKSSYATDICRVREVRVSLKAPNQEERCATLLITSRDVAIHEHMVSPSCLVDFSIMSIFLGFEYRLHYFACCSQESSSARKGTQ